jgi:hypothetical protein
MNISQFRKASVGPTPADSFYSESGVMPDIPVPPHSGAAFAATARSGTVLEQERDDFVQVATPDLPLVSALGSHEGVLDIVFLQPVGEGLVAGEKAVLLAARDPSGF